MKKRKKHSVSIQYQNVQNPSAFQSAVLFLCRFFMFFSASLGFLLSLLLTVAIPWNFQAFIPWLFAFSLFFTIMFSLSEQQYRRNLFLCFCVLGGLILYLKHGDFSREAQAFLGNLNHIFEESYELSLFPAYVYKGENYQLFFPAAAGVFLLLFYLAATAKKTFFLLFLLVLPPSLDFLLNINPSFASLGFLLSAFLFWRIVKQNPVPGILALTAPCCVLFLYFLCAEMFVPSVSPNLFQWRKPIHQKVNEIRRTLFEQTPASLQSAGTSGKERTYSRESLSNTAPVHSNETMFSFSTDSCPAEAIYLRGFVGKTYSGTQWIAPEDEEWTDFLRAKKRNLAEASLILNLPFHAVNNQERRMYEMTLSPAFSASYSYLPWGVEIPSALETGESNALENSFSNSVNFSGIPLALSDAEIFQSPDLSSREAAIENLYSTYVQKQYKNFPKDTLSTLRAEIQNLPVFQSMPDNPSVSQIQDAAHEIQEFLWSLASYSLTLEQLPFGNEFVEDFLFRQHQGFCVHFATAGTLLFRMYGIPARYVTGYVIRPQDLNANANGGYSCQITDASAHAWTEVYVGKGGWIPVEVTPAASDNPAALPENQETVAENQPEPEPMEQEPEISPETPSEHGETETTNSASKEENRTETPPSGKSFLSVLRILTLLLVGIGVLFAALLLWRTLCFRKHLGYFAASSYDSFQTVFKSLLTLWERLYDFSSKGLSDQELFLLFTEKLPEKEQKIFLEFYQMAEGFTFGQEKPVKKQLRDLRMVYGIYRKKLLKNSNPFQKFYIGYVLGL